MATKRRLQVFVSSTYRDLLAERQAAVSAILKAGHIPAGMELFTAGDVSQMTAIKAWIDESDVYMLILGGRYGSIEPTTGVSYTELEFDYALEQKKSLFAVVINEPALEAKVRAEGSDVLERENPKQLAQFRKKVMSNLCAFFDDPKDVRLAVYETLADFAANRELKGWVRSDEIVDTAPLFAEIQKLSEESRQLKAAAAELEKRRKDPDNEVESLVDLRRVLSEIEVNVPPDVAAGAKDVKLDLLTLMYENRDLLVNGVTNRVDAGAVETFYYFSVCPKLHVHGLVASEKVAGVRYRRYAVTRKGAALLAEVEKALIEVKKKKKEKEEAKKPETVKSAAIEGNEKKKPGASVVAPKKRSASMGEVVPH